MSLKRSVLFEKPDMIQTLSREGIEVDRMGRFRCPFHEDVHPSGKVYAKGNRWWCFSCNIGGDVIDFIMRHRELSFKDALAFLGLDGRRTPTTIKADREISKRQNLRQNYRETLQRMKRELSDFLRGLYRLTDKWKAFNIDDETRDSWSEAVSWIPLIEYKLDILFHGTEEEMFHLYKDEVRK